MSARYQFDNFIVDNERDNALPSGDDAVEISEDDPLRSISPRGYCVEGLDAQTFACLLQVVG